MGAKPSSSRSILPHIDNNTVQEQGVNDARMYRLQVMEGLINEEVAAIFYCLIMIIMMIKKMIMWTRLQLFRFLSFFSLSLFPPRTSLRHPSFRLHWKKDVWFSFQVHSCVIAICLDSFYSRSNISTSISSQVPLAVSCSFMEMLKSITSLLRSFILSQPNLNSSPLIPSPVTCMLLQCIIQNYLFLQLQDFFT
jgi:hypothetical protein